jgi:hypothetical protein
VPRLGRVAARVVGRRVEVRCWSPRQWRRLLREERELSVGRVDARAIGFTALSAHRISLRSDVCLAVADLAAGRHALRRHEDEAALALLVFAHEIQHAAGVVAESAADCRGMQTMARVGALLGMERRYAERLARVYRSMYPRQPRIYYSSECRDGGRLDLRPASHSWPS